VALRCINVQANPRRQLALAAICAAAIALAPPIAKAQTAIRLATGESRTVTFVENPSTGNSLAIDPAASRNLDALSITDLGYLAGGETMPGAPGKHSWRIGGVSPGQAEISFVYVPVKRLRSKPTGLR
jgi:predicted secreted protein